MLSSVYIASATLKFHKILISSQNEAHHSNNEKKTTSMIANNKNEKIKIIFTFKNVAIKQNDNFLNQYNLKNLARSHSFLKKKTNKNNDNENNNVQSQINKKKVFIYLSTISSVALKKYSINHYQIYHLEHFQILFTIVTKKFTNFQIYYNYLFYFKSIIFSIDKILKFEIKINDLIIYFIFQIYYMSQIKKTNFNKY